MSRARGLVAIGLLASALAGCRTPATEVLVVVDSNAPTDRVLSLHVRVDDGMVPLGDSSAAGWTRGGAPANLTLPASFAVVPPAGASPGSAITLTIEAQLGRSPRGDPPRTLRRIARFRFTPGATTEVPVYLAASCGNFTAGCTSVDAAHCTVSAWCEERNLTCGDRGDCVPQEVTPLGIDGGVLIPVTVPDVVDVYDAFDAYDATDTHDAFDAYDATDTSDVTTADSGPPPTAPRPIAPLSTALVSNQHPTLTWTAVAGSDGAQVDLCSDRACTNVATQFMATGTHGSPGSALAPGVWFWRLHGRRGTLVGAASTRVWQFTVPRRDPSVDTSFGSVLDVDGDGFADVVAASYGAHSAAGSVMVFRGSSGGTSTTPATTLNGIFGTGGEFGTGLASAGDVNGDGFADVIIGEPCTAATGTPPGNAYVYLGSASGLATTPATTLHGPGSARLRFGVSVASAGDVNDDGYGDVMVGAPLDRGGVGRAYLYFGSANGIDTTPHAIDIPTSEVNAQFGKTLASGGDLNGDREADLLIAAEDVNQVFVFYGDGSGTPARNVVIQPADYGQFGLSISPPGDANGDGYSDLLAGAPDFDTVNHIGRAYEYLGASAGVSTTPDVTIASTGGNSGFFGWSAAIVGDVDGDGFDDAMVGAPGGAGLVSFYRGTASGTDSNADTTVNGQAGDQMGRTVRRAGDVNGDGYADAVFGASGHNGFAGVVYVHAGGAGGFPASPSFTIPVPTCCDGEFGYFIATLERAARRESRRRARERHSAG